MIEINISRTLGRFHLNMEVKSDSRRIGILGASGCGKSMPLGCIAGIESPDRGRIVLEGRTLYDRDQKINVKPQKRKIGYLFQNYALFPTMSVRKNIMAGLKCGKAEQEQIATLVFDEVDTGVSGRAAQKVAEKLRSVARNKQVLCVTHLPQIAALADTHLLIAKGERDGRTYTTVTPLDREGRKLELARIIGGASITEITLKSAEEMLTSGV